ncbi:MAG TPA: hypothetical protein VI011_26215 [Asanoa sp.]
MPTSVLLAVLAAAGLLALAPALVRRYDATERLVAERALSTARVLSRQRRRRTVPGRRPVRVGRMPVVTLRPGVPDASVSAPRVSRRHRRLRPVSAVPAPRHLLRQPLAVYRRRRVLASLFLLNAVELVGVFLVGRGFWVSVAVTGTLLGVYVAHLRNKALADRRARRRAERHAGWLAARQAEVRREQARRATARREAQKRLIAQREAVRRAAMGLESASGSVSYRRAVGLRGRAYEAGRGRAHTA